MMYLILRHEDSCQGSIQLFPSALLFPLTNITHLDHYERSKSYLNMDQTQTKHTQPLPLSYTHSFYYGWWREAQIQDYD